MLNISNPYSNETIKRAINLLFMAIIVVIVSNGCVQADKGADMTSLEREAEEAWKQADVAKTDSLGAEVIMRAEETGNKINLAKGYLYSSYYEERMTDSVVKSKSSMLEKARAIAIDEGNYALLCRIYNQLGVLEMLHNQAFSLAAFYFTKSIEAAEKAHLPNLGVSAEMNLSEACLYTGDTINRQYERQMLDYAKTNNDSRMLYFAARLGMQNQIKHMKDSSELSPYLDLISDSEDYTDLKEIMLARFFYGQGEYEKAERHLQNADFRMYYDCLLLHAKILNKQHKYRESNETLDGIIEHAPNKEYFIRPQINKLMSENYRALGDYKSASEYQTEYIRLIEAKDSLDNIHRLSQYKVEYDVLKKDSEISRQQVEMSRLKIIIAAAVLLLLFVVAGSVFYIHRRNKFYRSIVHQNIDSLRQTPADLPQESPSGISDEKADEIFRAVIRYVEGEQAWKDTSVTRDSMAEVVGCNRTYLSEVIKRKTGMNYSRFMNSYRIKEAIRILSNPADKTPLKQISEQLGFLTTTNFSSLFKQETGISPTAFRKTANEMTKNNELTDNDL